METHAPIPIIEDLNLGYTVPVSLSADVKARMCLIALTISTRFHMSADKGGLLDRN